MNGYAALSVLEQGGFVFPRLPLQEFRLAPPFLPGATLSGTTRPLLEGLERRGDFLKYSICSFSSCEFSAMHRLVRRAVTGDVVSIHRALVHSSFAVFCSHEILGKAIGAE